MTTGTRAGSRVNGLDLDALNQVVREIEQDPRHGMVGFRVHSAWRGQTRSRSTVDSYTIGGQKVFRHFEVDVDEPHELLGQNSAPNPQEMLMTALNACVMVGYVAGAAVKGITLEKVEIDTDGELDLRGFLGIDPGVRPGYEAIRYTVRIKGDGTPEQFREIHETVMKTSPNFWNVSRPIRIDATLEVE
ncbi:MAG TPA: OsmC family protein [Candidatus Methylomirabilis sp.]|nr:OsmC family protein [Candidatus Methylomirabilis sp.]